MQNRVVHAGPSAQCRAVCSMQDRLLNAGPSAQCVHVSEELLDSERLFAFMDDVYVCCGPDRVEDIHQSMEREMWDHARIQLHQGKTQLWNRGGTAPQGWETMTAVARVDDPTAVLWKGDPSLPPSQQGLRILGTPLGHPEYVRNQPRRVSESHRSLLERIPSVQDLQSAWLLLLFCEGTRANYLLRAIPPQQALEFETHHTASVQECLTRILGAEIPPKSWEVANLPLSLGGMGLRSAPRVSPSAYWSSWADCLQTTASRQPVVAEQLTTALSNREAGSYLGSAVASRDRLLEAGFPAPGWGDLTADNPPRPRRSNLDQVEPGTRPGWQKESSLTLEERLVSDSLWPRLTPQRRALFRSQGGPMTSVPYTCFPIAPHCRFDPQPFRVLLLRRLSPSPDCSLLPVWPATGFSWPIPSSLR